MSTEDITMKNTKKEMMDVISVLQKELSEKEKTSLNPQKIKQEQKEQAVIQKAEETVKSDLSGQLNSLKTEIIKELSGIGEKLDSEVTAYKNLLEAIAVKKTEIENIYGIEKEALNLTLLLEAQKKQKENFDLQFRAKQEIQETEINEVKANWDKEKKNYQDSVKEEKTALDKERKREAEEYTYKVKREREIEQNKYNDELEKVKKEIAVKKEEYDKFYKTKTEEIVIREEAVTEREKKMEQLEKTVAAYPGELEKAVNKAEQETEKRITNDFQKNEIMLKHIHAGEINVLNAKIAALDTTVKDQAKQIDKLSISQERAYEKVQNIANKAVDGASERMRNITVKVPSKSEEN